MIAIMWVDLEETNGGVDGDEIYVFALIHVRESVSFDTANGPQTNVKCARKKR